MKESINFTIFSRFFSTLVVSFFFLAAEQRGFAISRCASRHWSYSFSTSSMRVTMDFFFSLSCTWLSSSSKSLMTSFSLTSPASNLLPNSMMCSIPTWHSKRASNASFSPASILLAISTSPSLVSREIQPISFRYIFTGSETLVPVSEICAR